MASAHARLRRRHSNEEEREHVSTADDGCLDGRRSDDSVASTRGTRAHRTAGTWWRHATGASKPRHSARSRLAGAPGDGLDTAGGTLAQPAAERGEREHAVDNEQREEAEEVLRHGHGVSFMTNPD